MKLGSGRGFSPLGVPGQVCRVFSAVVVYGTPGEGTWELGGLELHMCVRHNRSTQEHTHTLFLACNDSSHRSRTVESCQLAGEIAPGPRRSSCLAPISCCAAAATLTAGLAEGCLAGKPNQGE